MCVILTQISQHPTVDVLILLNVNDQCVLKHRRYKKICSLFIAHTFGLKYIIVEVLSIYYSMCCAFMENLEL